MIFRKLLSFVDKWQNTEYRAQFEIFRDAYHQSKEYSRVAHVLSGIWIIAAICLRLLPNVIIPVYGEIPQSTANLLFYLIGAFALLAAFVILPILFYRRSGTFAYETSWFPIQSTGHVIKAAQNDVFRAETTKDYDIAVIIKVPGRVNDLSVQLHSNNEHVDFSVQSQLPAGMSSYPNNKGFSFDNEIEDDTVTPVLQIKKRRRLRGAPNAYVTLYEVSGSDSSPPLPVDELDSQGEELLKINVTD